MSMQIEKLTPAMRQYIEVKKQYPDCVLLFRIGDFYETFFEDAHICAKVLDLVITSKNKMLKIQYLWQESLIIV